MDIHRCFSARKRKQVRRACLNCQKAHSGCGEQRPCPRCVKRKEEHKCVDAPRRKKQDLPSEEGADSDGFSSYNDHNHNNHNNKRKRKLSSSSGSSPASPGSPFGDTSLVAGQHSDDECCVTKTHKPQHQHQQQPHQQQHSALVVRNNKRPRRNKWPAGSAFFSPMALPLSNAVKTEQTTQQLQQPQQHNNFGQALSQKLSLLEQPPVRTQYIVNKKELGEDSFLFNPQEFDCVVSPSEQPFLQQQHPQTQPQPQPPCVEDLSLEWVMPELYLWGSTTTTTTTSTSSPFPSLWGQQEQQQQVPPSSLWLGEDNAYGSFDETPFFYADYRTFEPLFSF